MKIIEILIVIFAIIGFYITLRIASEKKKKLSGKQMVCFVGQDCEKVVFSEYSKFLGISLEKMGLVYYLVVAVVYLVNIFIPSVLNDLIMFVVLGMTFGGLLFSIYLTMIQIVKLKNYCSWCISSAVTSTIIFALTLAKNLAIENKIFEYLNSYSEIISITKSVSVILILAVTLSLVVYRKKTSRTLRIIEQVSWFSAFLFILSNIESSMTLSLSELLAAILLVLNFINIKLARRLIILSTNADNK